MPNSDPRSGEVLVIDYGVGNHQSVINALDLLGYRYSVSCQPDDIARAGSYVLPGVGAFKEAMNNLKERAIIDVLRVEVVQHKKPILGICLGMQVLAEDSEEDGHHKGLGWIPGSIVRIPSSDGLRVPHVGWNRTKVRQRKPLFSHIADDAHFYFDHSYHFQTENAYIAATVSYGEDITAAVQYGNIYGVQFHPEKSQVSGLRLLRAFFEASKM